MYVKKMLTQLLLSFLFLGPIVIHGQIVLETTYSHSGTYASLPLSGNKFYIMDVGNSQCRIYNTNHSLWKTINLSVPANNYLYDIKYLSENLFSTDNSLCLAYVYYSYNETGQYYSYNAKIVKENGSVLLSIPGCQYLYLHTLDDGSTKLVAYSYNYAVFPSTIITSVYNLPGSLVSTTEKDMEALAPPMPNPAREQVNIPYLLPAEYSRGQLVIFDIQGKRLASWPIENASGVLTIPVASFPRGTYIYHVEAGSYRSESNKIILQ